MKKIWIAGLLGAVMAMPALADDAKPVASEGQMLYDTNTSRVAPVRKVTEDGSAQVIVEGKMVTVPANTLSVNDGKLKTTDTKNQVIIRQ